MLSSTTHMLNHNLLERTINLHRIYTALQAMYLQTSASSNNSLAKPLSPPLSEVVNVDPHLHLVKSVQRNEVQEVELLPPMPLLTTLLLLHKATHRVMSRLSLLRQLFHSIEQDWKVEMGMIANCLDCHSMLTEAQTWRIGNNSMRKKGKRMRHLQ